jgi:L-iditol 2-dehydrogenase
MHAAVYRGKGRVVVENVPVPEIGPGEVLLRVAACGICGTDIKKIQHGAFQPEQVEKIFQLLKDEIEGKTKKETPHV